MPREPEPHEPLVVERSGEVFEELDSPLVDLDELVEGRQDSSNPLLSLKRGKREHERAECLGVCVRLSCAPGLRDDEALVSGRLDDVPYESRVDTWANSEPNQV